jgi:lipopolysaccharide transport system ATP-binding protein
MMVDTLVSVENISKKFCKSLRRSLWYGLQDLGRELAAGNTERKDLRPDEFWALRDVSLEVKRGDTVGLIGRNGAGKTTLLRMMNGLLKPDKGRIKVRGRMQALIALGAGFNPVLTGRENIYVNGAILGIPKIEIDRRFDEIVEFSGLAEFIEAPVQSYSSGMVVRLGFSVAVHMEPDILLVDEVLAVGDIPFRAKCHRKLGELKDRGIPWILVSHDMGTIRNQTNKVVYLDKGKMQFVGTPEEGIASYLYVISQEQYQQGLTGASGVEAETATTASQGVRIGTVTLLDENCQEREFFQTGEPLFIRIDYAAHERLDSPSFGVHILSGDGICHIAANTYVAGFQIDYIEEFGSVFYRMDALSLLPGIYQVRIDIWDQHMGMRDKKNTAAYLHVKGGGFGGGTHYSPHSWQHKPGPLLPLQKV